MAQHLTIDAIQAAVAEHYLLPRRLMTKVDKAWPAPQARQVAMYLARNLLGQSWADLGRGFQRDPTTIAHGVKAVAKSEALLREATHLQAKLGA